MQRNRMLTGIGSFIGILVLIIDSRSALEGAREGINLCMQTIIPSLFPFFVLSIALTSSFMGCSMRILEPIGRLFHIPKGAESLLVSAFLGGYPVGAQSIAVAYRNGNLSKADAERMLGYCNNAGPSFLFGMGAILFSNKSALWVIWFILMISSLFVARLRPCAASTAVYKQQSEDSISEYISSAVKTMGAVCGWVILFRVVISFFRRWFLWLLPKEAQIVAIGVLELSNGFFEMTGMDNPGLRLILCCGLLAFGGLCVTMQTFAVTKGLSCKSYLAGKLLQTLFATLLSACVVNRIWTFPVIALLLCIIPVKIKKSDSIPRKAIV